MRNTLIIFDFDKTLADAGELQVRASEEVCKPYGIKMDETSLDDCAGSTLYESTQHLLEKCFQKKGIEKAVMKEDIDRAINRRTSKLILLLEKRKPKVYQGVPQLLTCLQEHAYLGLVTGNQEKSGSALLASANLLQFFRPYLRVFSEEFPGGDRVNGMILCVKNVEHYDGKCARTIYVGDNKRDIENGRKFRDLMKKRFLEVKTAIVNHEGRNAEELRSTDFFFDNFKDYEQVARDLLDF